jgi:hypothetical protein
MMAGWEMIGRSVAGATTRGPLGTWNWIVSVSAVLLASWIAARSVHSAAEPTVPPVAQMPFPIRASGASPVEFTVKTAGAARTAAGKTKATIRTAERVACTDRRRGPALIHVRKGLGRCAR